MLRGLRKVALQFCLLFAGSMNSAFGQIIFQDNFDNSPDWRSKQTVSKSAGGMDIAWPTPTYDKTCTAYCPPQGWTGYRASSSYYTDNPGRDTLILDSASDRGGSGKGITYNVEVTGAYGNWSAGSLYLYLGSAGYQELYVRYWLKYTSEWQWTNPQANQHGLQKLLRIARMSGNIDDPNVDPSSYYTPSWQGPIFIPDFYYNSAFPPAQLMVTEDYDPRASGDISSNWSSFRWPGDSQWHCYEFRVKMNSAPGVADGEWEVWIDGASTADKHAVKKGVPWVNAGKTTTQGWNWLMILDNVTNASAPLSDRKEMSIYMDDVVVYSPMSSTDKECGGNCSADGRLPIGFNLAYTSASKSIDKTAPTAVIRTPLSGAAVTGTTTVTVNASDNVGVTKVEFYVNGVLKDTETVAPYSFSWDTAAIANGSYTLSAKSYDAAGNAGQSSTISVTVNNPVPDTTAPSVSLTAPANNATVKGTITVSAAASDNVGVSRIDFYLNGALRASVNVTPYSFNWDTKSVANGSNRLMAKAYDAAGNAGKCYIDVSVSNPIPDTTPPTITVTSPSSGATVGGTTSITAGASDNVGVAKVEFYVNGILKATDSASPYAYSWDTKAVADGSHILLAKAYDAAGNVGLSPGIAVTVKNTIPDTSSPGISILTPVDKATVNGTVQVRSYAVDNVGVKKVEYYVNGGLKSTLTASPYSFIWDTRTAANGSCRLLARAYDTAGNMGTYYINVSVKNTTSDTSSPGISILTPADRATVSGIVKVTSYAVDNVGVKKVEYYLNGVLKSTLTTSPYSYSWDTRTAMNGSCRLLAKAYDAAGNVGTYYINLAIKN